VITTRDASNEEVNLAIIGARVVLPAQNVIVASAQVALQTGTWTGAVWTVKVSNDPDQVFFRDHPDGLTLTAEGVIGNINCNGWRWVALELTTASSVAGTACVYIVGKDAGVTSSGVSATSPALMTGADPMIRVLMSPLAPGSVAFLLTTDTGYWVFLGRIPEAKVVKFVEFYVTAGGVGAQTAEVALASGSGPPSKGSITLTKIAADGTLDALTGTGMKRNTTTMAASVPAGTFLYAGIRTAMAATQPTIGGISSDNAEGFVLSTATPGALTGAGPWTGAVVGANLYGTAVAPDIRATLD